jgi:hypothetical protein
MNHRFLFLLALVATISSPLCGNSIFNLLEKEYIANISAQNSDQGQITRKAFSAFHALKNSNDSDLFANESIANLFAQPTCRAGAVGSAAIVKNAQDLMIILLYGTIFHRCIQQTEQFGQEVCISLDYWRKEMFYDTLPIFRKHPMYWYHSNNHKQLVTSHVQALTNLEQEILQLLGIALHARHALGKIQHETDFASQLQQSCNPLHQHFHMVQQFDNMLNVATTWQDVAWIHQSIAGKMKEHKKTLNQHKKPNHFIEHKFFYGCLAATLLTAYIAYEIHEENIPEYQKKAADSWNNFKQEYVLQPFIDLKEILWDGKTEALDAIQSLSDLPALTQDTIQVKADGPITVTTPPTNVNIGLNEYLKTKVAVDSKEIKVQAPDVNIKIPLKDANAYVDIFNDNRKKLTHAGIKLLKNQQLTIAACATIPAAFIAYSGYKITNYAYNKYIKHESWYQPMKLILRDMDKTLNNLTACKARSFQDDGRLHLLILRLKKFMYCLSNEELQLLEQDLHELTDYQLSYEQKQSVLKRMYKTYEFLA